MHFPALYLRLMLTGTAAALCGAAAPVWAGCPCQESVAGPVAVSPAGPGCAYPEGVYGMENPAPILSYAPLTPPPGTLGQTYALRSRPVPTDKHPRVGMIDIRAEGATRIIVHDTNEFRTEDKLEGFRDVRDPNLYHFTSEPLYPGLPHIYRVEIHREEQVQEYYVRLIMGRVVQLVL